MVSVRAGVAYCTAVFALGVVLGTARTLVLAPALGETVAVALELPIILAAAWFVCSALIRRFAVPTRTSARLVMGAVALALLLLAEAVLAVAAFGASLAEHLAGYHDGPRALGLVGQIVFAVFPLAQQKVTRSERA